MIQTQQFEGFPVFGDNSSKSQPEAAIYSNGFAPADVLPAEYYNWLTNKSSVGITDLNRGLSSVEAELNNVVTAGGAEPTEETSNQVITAIKYLIAQAKSEAILDAHPVGSLYWSSKNTNPSQLFGGTWTQIKDKFILAAGDTYTNGATGGAATVTLTINQIPSHTHTGPSHTHSFTPAGTVSSHTHTGPSHTHSFTPAGTVSSHSHTMSHNHSFTPSGTVSSHIHGLNDHKHTFSGTTGTSNADITIDTATGFFLTDNIPASSGDGYIGAHGFVKHVLTNDPALDNLGGSIDTVGNDGDGKVVLDHNHGITQKSHSHSFSGTTVGNSGNTTSTQPSFTGTAGTTGAASSSNTGATQPTFTGTAGTTGAAGTGNTGAATPTFTGKAGTTGAAGTGNTGAVGGGSSHDNMPPYIVKYCWERTA